MKIHPSSIGSRLGERKLGKRERESQHCLLVTERLSPFIAQLDACEDVLIAMSASK